MARKTQWVLDATEVLAVAGHTAVGRPYMRADPNQAQDVIAVDSLRSTPMAGFTRDTKEVFRVAASDIIRFLRNAGEQLPANPVMFLRPIQLTPTSPVVDEIVIAEDTVEGRV